MIKRILSWLLLEEDDEMEKKIQQMKHVIDAYCYKMPNQSSGIPQDIPQKTTYVECKTCGVLVAHGKAKEHSHIVNRVPGISIVDGPELRYEKTIVTDYFCTRCAKRSEK